MQPPKGPEAALKSKLLLFLKGEPSELDAILAHTAMAAGIAGIFGHFGHLHQNVPWLPVLVFVVSSLWHGFELDRGRAFPEVRAMVAYTAIVAVGGGVLLQDNAIEAGRIGSIYGGFVLALLFGGSNLFVSVLHETIQRFTCSKLFSTEDTKSRNADAMAATAREQAFAREQGVQLLFWAQPLRFLAEDGVLAGVEFEHTGLDDHGRLAGKGERFVLPADVALKAVGQVMSIEGLETDNEQPGPRLRERRRADGHGMQVRDSRIIVDDNYATSLAGVWAGGDCVAGKTVLTVQAAEDGKRAAQAIDRVLMGRP